VCPLFLYQVKAKRLIAIQLSLKRQQEVKALSKPQIVPLGDFFYFFTPSFETMLNLMIKKEVKAFTNFGFSLFEGSFDGTEKSMNHVLVGSMADKNTIVFSLNKAKISHFFSECGRTDLTYEQGFATFVEEMLFKNTNSEE
jgi:hypothetical protein